MASSPAGQSRVLPHPAIRRVLGSGGVAGGLGLVFWLVVYVGSRSHITAGLTCGGGTWGCLGVAILAGLAGLIAMAVLAWPLMHAAGVRPAWPVALLGPIVAISVYREFLTLIDRSLITGLWILLAVSYTAAAVITAPRLYRYWSAVVAIAVIAMDLAMRFLPGR